MLYFHRTVSEILIVRQSETIRQLIWTMFCNPNFRLSKASLSQATNRIFLILSLGLVLGVVYRYCWLGKNAVADALERASKVFEKA